MEQLTLFTPDLQPSPELRLLFGVYLMHYDKGRIPACFDCARSRNNKRWVEQVKAGTIEAELICQPFTCGVCQDGIEQTEEQFYRGVLGIKTESGNPRQCLPCIRKHQSTKFARDVLSGKVVREILREPFICDACRKSIC